MADANLAGFCLLALPNPQIQPLSILTSKDKSHAETTNVDIKNIFVDNTEPLPRPTMDAAILKDASRSVVVELSVEGNANLLQHLLSFLKLSATFKLEKSRSIMVRLENARKTGVNEFDLDAFVNSAKASQKSETFLEMLNKNELFVVTDIIKCKKYAFEYSDNKVTSAQLKVDTPLDGGGNAGVHTTNSAKEDMTYEGDEDITLAVKAYRILYNHDKKTGRDKYRIRKEEALATVKGPEKFSGDRLDAELVLSPQ
ncbi:MAG TPA: hypothetical protein VKQ52_07905 [Puia sp.]|nr:hypothetical protein [Puia sp.]